MAAIAAAIATIPPQNRKLLTYHDSFVYFSPRYGMTVIVAIEPASFSEPSPREVTRVIRQLKREKVPGRPCPWARRGGSLSAGSVDTPKFPEPAPESIRR
jgi:hypothetical protein